MTAFDAAPSLFRAYRDDFMIGAAINPWMTENDAYRALILRHFNSVTLENDMKPERILRREKTLAGGDPLRAGTDFSLADRMLSFAQENGLKVRFHVLCWHNQTPRWFFIENWAEGPDAPFASREVILARQENYIRDVMTHVNERFAGTVYAWDVVNEAIEPDQGQPGLYRERSPWYRSAGPDFLPAAFRAARKYQAPGQQLYYNDYNAFEPVKRDAILAVLTALKRESLVDGMGMQGHMQLDWPAVAQCEEAVRMYAALGLNVQVTELDIHCPGSDEARQRALADRYGEYFGMLLRLRREGLPIGSVTFWGVTDRDSWLTGFRREGSYPLLFDAEKQTKPAFDAVYARPWADRVIRVNQAGYAQGLPKHAAVLAEGEALLRDGRGEPIRRYPLAPRADEASGDRVALIELGDLPAGEYTLEAGGALRKITVAPRPWQTAENALIKGFYFQRCGCALEEKYAGPWAHPACHTAVAREWGNPALCRAVPGGWHDAGDYGKYTGPGAVAAAHLMYAWLLFPQGCSDDLGIPETGSGIPDILSETRYELAWLTRMQREDGAFYHKLTKAHFAPFIMPQDDTEPEYLMPVSHCATAAAAACLALASRVFRPFAPAFANRMLLAAQRGWRWLEKHPDFAPFMNPEGVRTGWYGDRSDRDEKFWAACELYAATGDAAYARRAEALYGDGELNPTAFGWADVSGLGALCCLFQWPEAEALKTRIGQDLTARAEALLARCHASGYGTALAPEGYTWGSILPIMSAAMAMIAAYRLTGREDMRAGALLQWDYALGLNALDLCFVTGIGERSVRHPHHRPSGADGVEDPVPGLLSGGPNGRMLFPPTRQILGDCVPPAKSFLDETPSADTNEIAVYWNSPAVFVGAFLNAGG